MEDFCGSAFWDTNLTWHSANPEFTPCFESIVFNIFPCAFLWFFALADVYFSANSHFSSVRIPWSFLNLSKCCLSLILIILDIVQILEDRVFAPNSDSDYVQYPAELYMPLIRLITLVLSIALLLYAKRKGVTSSGIQFLYWLLFTICQAFLFRSAINTKDRDVLTSTQFGLQMAYFPVVVVQLFLHCWADTPTSPGKGDKIGETSQSPKLAPDTTCSFLNGIMYEWFTSWVWRGWRQPLVYEDLPELNPEIGCASVVPRFDKHWPMALNPVPKGETEQKQERKVGGVMNTILKAFGPQYAFAMMIRIVPDLLLFVSPQILNLLIGFVGPESKDEPLWKGVFYAVILFVNALTSCIFSSNGSQLFYKVGISIKSALVSAVYRKSLLLSNSAKRDQSTGEIVNRMAVDVVYLSEFTQSANLLFTSPIILALALYFLFDILGVAALAGVTVMIIILPLNAFIASRVQRLQKEQMAYKDRRSKLMNDVLNGMKVIKLYAWEPSFETMIKNIREKELSVLRRQSFWNAFANFLATCAPALVAITTFGTYVLMDKDNVLDAQTAFVSLSLFNVMNQPLTYMPLLISNCIQAVVGMKRLNIFFNSDEVDLAAVSHNPNEQNPVVIENGTFSWEVNDRSQPTLQDINLIIRDGQLVAMVGPVGSGKSSLLSALLNELIKIQGRVNLRGSVAYVAQQAWIQNATVRDNIIFGRPFDPRLYRQVIEACALSPDLDILPAGDRTEIGEKGINLSGGQKQRISLARACYSQAEIYLMDDCLSAVDAHVGRHIFDKVVGPKGLLRKRTRLLVTHGIVHLPQVDQIFVLSHGRITETGTYSHLLEKNGDFAEFLKTHSSAEERTEEPTPTTRKLSRQMSTISEAGNDSIRLRRGRLSTYSVASHTSNTMDPMDAGLGDTLIEKEKPETSSVKAGVYLDYLRNAGLPFSLMTLAFYCFYQSFSVGGNLWLSRWSNENSSNRNGYYLGIYALFGLLQALGILSASIFMALGVVRSARALHNSMLVGVLRAPLQFFDVTPIGRIINRFTRDVDSLDNMLPLFLRFWLNCIFQVIAVVVVITISTPIFGAVIIPMGIAYWLVQRFFISTSRQLKRLESVSRSPIYSHFGETISGSSTIRAYGAQERFIRELEFRQDTNIKSYYNLQVANRWLQVRLEIMGNTLVFFAALFAVLGRDNLDPGVVGLSVSYALQVTMALMFVVRFTTDVENNIVAVERMKEYGECDSEAEWQFDGRKLSENWPHEGKVTFENYQTRYRPGLDLVLRGISCEMRGGEKVGVVGRTGAGKSSVTLALFRIVEAMEGRIVVDGEDIGTWGLHQVRGRLTIIPQEPMLFGGSLRENLDPFGGMVDDQLWRALDLAHLKDFIKELPGGLDYEVAEGGDNLSVGQRQLLCLARALLRKSKILVLDEATSAVDLDTEELILKTIREEFRESTVITIAHRLNTILDSDRVLVLDKGEIKEFDTPQNLLRNPSSIFYSMAKEAGIAETTNAL